MPKVFVWCNGYRYYPVRDDDSRCFSDGWHNRLQPGILELCRRAELLSYESLLAAGMAEELVLSLLLVDEDPSPLLRCSGYPSKAPVRLYHLVEARNALVLAQFPEGLLAEQLAARPEHGAVPYARSRSDPDMWLLLDVERHESTGFEGVEFHGFERDEFLRCVQGEATSLEKRFLFVPAENPPIAASQRLMTRWEAERGAEALLLLECPHVPPGHLCPPEVS